MLRVVLVVTLFMNLIACTTTPDWKAIYGEKIQEKDASKLEVPPDLSEPDVSDSLALPNIVAGGSTYSAYTNVDQSGIKVLSATPRGVKVIRDGKEQWLEVKGSADKLWPELKVFFTKIGFEIKREEKKLGFMETDWLETKAYVPDNWISKLLNRVVATGLKDKYRVRLEKTKNKNVTRLFFTHQGQQEHATDDANGASYGNTFIRYWVNRESDSELEAEMYQRFLIFRDLSKEEATEIAAHITAKERTLIFDKDETKMLQVGEGFARTWRRVGIALDRIGLLVEDRDRSGGLYYLRITDDFRSKVKEEDSWLASLFSNDKVKIRDRYLLSVSDEKDKTIISIYETTGAKADADFVKKLLTDLKSYLD